MNTINSVVPKIGTRITARNADLLQDPLPVYKYPYAHTVQYSYALHVAHDTSHYKHAVAPSTSENQYPGVHPGVKYSAQSSKNNASELFD